MTLSLRWMLIFVCFIPVACLPGESAGSDDAVRVDYEQWISTTGINSRNVSFRVISEDGESAIVVVMAEHQYFADGPWLSEQATIQVRRTSGEWQGVGTFRFSLTEQAQASVVAARDMTVTASVEASRATDEALKAEETASAEAEQVVQTADAVAAEATASVLAVTATSEAEIAQATAAAEEAASYSTATAMTNSDHATATARAEDRAETATSQAEQSSATAAAQHDATSAARAEETARLEEASTDFEGNSLPPEWRVRRPDPANWVIVDSVLRLFPRPPIEDRFGEYYNEFIRPMPSLVTDLDIVIRLWVYPKEVGAQFFWIDLRVGENLCPSSFYIGAGLSTNGPYIAAAQYDMEAQLCDSSLQFENRRDVSFPLDEAIHIKIERRQGTHYTAYVSADGQSWTYINDVEGQAYDTIAIAGWAEEDTNFYGEVNWIRFSVPD